MACCAVRSAAAGCAWKRYTFCANRWAIGGRPSPCIGNADRWEARSRLSSATRLPLLPVPPPPNGKKPSDLARPRTADIATSTRGGSASGEKIDRFTTMTPHEACVCLCIAHFHGFFTDDRWRHLLGGECDGYRHNRASGRNDRLGPGLRGMAPGDGHDRSPSLPPRRVVSAIRGGKRSTSALRAPDGLPLVAEQSASWPVRGPAMALLSGAVSPLLELRHNSLGPLVGAIYLMESTDDGLFRAIQAPLSILQARIGGKMRRVYVTARRLDRNELRHTVPVLIVFYFRLLPVSYWNVPASQQPVSPGRSPGQSLLLHKRLTSPGNSRRQATQGFAPRSGLGRSLPHTPRSGRPAAQAASLP